MQVKTMMKGEMRGMYPHDTDTKRDASLHQCVMWNNRIIVLVFILKLWSADSG
jgi:hypothetical protein